MINIIMHLLIIPKVETTTIKTNQEIVLSHRIEKAHKINKQNQNYRISTTKNQKQINQVQSTNKISPNPPGIGNTETSELQLSHINCEITDVESETKHVNYRHA